MAELSLLESDELEEELEDESLEDEELSELLEELSGVEVLLSLLEELSLLTDSTGGLGRP
ncbi:uncharacterized protein METZ01_LOCUS292906 [marine metagenome]|uniref:Uncharacterized protein n=1 Tax=marine metagenome TaxID=408172 RepID=A0A382LYA3_9ZZZZ